MTEPARTPTTEPTPEPTPAPRLSAAELEAQILRSRTELAAQVDELMGRVDPRRAVQEIPPIRLAAGAVAVVGLVAAVILLRRRRR